MKYQGLWKKVKQTLVMLLALALLLDGWTNHSLSVQAAEPEETITEDMTSIYSESENVKGNVYSLSGTGYQDGVTPRITLASVKNDAQMTARDGEGNYYFRTELTVEFTIEEEEAPAGEENSPIIVKRNDGTAVTELANGVAAGTFTDIITDTGTYIYTVEDEAGNVYGQNMEVKAVQSDAKPAIRISYPDIAIEVTTDKGTDIYFNADPDMNGSVQDSLGIAKIGYVKDGTYTVLKEYSGSDGSYATGTVSYEGSLKLGTLAAELQNAADGVYTYTFVVTNIVGTTAEETITFKVDKTEPDSLVFIAYETDGDCPNQQKDTGPIDFIGQVGGTIQKIFGKKTVIFHLYVKDGVPQSKDETAISGINTTELIANLTTLNGKLKTAQVAESSTAGFCFGGDEYIGYTHVTGTIVLPKESGYGQDQLVIGKLKDQAGNVLGGVTPTNITGVTVVYLDQIAPVLNADYGTGIISDDNRIYYRSAAEIGLSLKEAYYKEQTEIKDGVEQIVQPAIAFTSQAIGQTKAWAEPAFALDTANTKLTLPLATDAETSYQFTVQYQDRSGNKLEIGSTAKGSLKKEEGKFTNFEVIVDNKAPELREFKLTGETDLTVGGKDVYKNNVSGADMTISFTVEDHKTYWNPGNVTLKIRNITSGTTVKEISGSELEWSDQDSLHTASCEFDGEEGTEAEYQVQIAYADRAGNPMTDARKAAAGEILSGTWADNTYISVPFILDHAAPKFSIAYTKATRLVNPENGLDYIGSLTPVAGYTSYYKADITATITIYEAYAAPEPDEPGKQFTGLEDLGFFVYKEGIKQEVTKEISWKTTDGPSYQGTYTLSGDGEYQLEAVYWDAAGNKMAADNVQGSLEDGKYTSPTLIVDKTAPVMELSYNGTPVNVYDGRSYFHGDTIFSVKVTDQNFRVKELKESLQAFTAADSSGADLKDSVPARETIEGYEAGTIVNGTWTANILLSADANYNIPIAYTDLAGNPAVWTDGTDAGTHLEKSCVDKSMPDELNLSCTVSDSGLADAINYKDFGFWFADKKLTIRADGADKTAGIHFMRFTVTDENGKKSIFEKTLEPAAAGTYEVTIPMETADFKGAVKAEVVDWSGNIRNATRGSIVESAKKHNSTRSAVITTKTAPGRTIDGVDYYRSDVQFNLTLQDSYSGIKSFIYTGGRSLSKTMNYAEAAGTELGVEPTQDITYVYTEDLTLTAASNNQNDVKVQASFTDNAGHKGSVEQLYNIDITAPVITVEYDLNDPANEKYYNRTRTATVTIRERNFDSRDVEFKITNTDGAMPSISGWSQSGSGDDTLNVCTVTFSEDGDYTFTLAFQDMAGNWADYNRIDEFTVDKTLPKLTVTYDNNDYRNEYYYARSRTAVIDIEEHNFDPSLIDVRVTVTSGTLSVPGVSAWSKKGDHNIAHVTFSEDGEYTFTIAGKDLADHELPEYNMDHFVIDQTAPVVEIFDLEHMSANRGAVMPGVRCLDTNYDPDGIKIRMKGYRNGVQEMHGDRTYTAGGLEVRLKDFEHVPEMDDLYTMDAAVYDLAGNSSQANVIFSVNRFGSVYTFDDKTNALVGEQGKYYTKEEQDIVVIETNVDTLEFKEITCNLNGRLRTLKEGKDYTVEESGSDMSWKQYTYSVDKSNFEEEGTYLLTIYSEDRAANTSDNNTKGKKVEFAVDKTSPSILISGVEDKEQYRENNREVTLDVQDNICLADVKVTVDGKETTYSAAEVAEVDGKITFLVGSANHWQEMDVTAYDAAGNIQSTETIQFLITSNMLIQFFMNKALFYSFLGLLAVLGAGAGWFLIAGKQRKRKRTVNSALERGKQG